ncbi:MAG: zinc ribbon domain-containing protein [Chloroflexota bacterium]|jgi:putative FmdB family regulatory protein|nr:zinc ribbon domain-containing protein [Chloroflexota bacterium]MDP6756823.1 zinc ribbon domain-containing protein [Chloroflexota bacterium]
MPTYAYVCDNCEHELEQVQSFSDDALERCPSCDEDELRRRIFPAGIIFKGNGWYATDNRPKEDKQAAKKDSKDPSSSSKSDEKPIEAAAKNGGETAKASDGAAKASGGAAKASGGAAKAKT